MAISARRLEAVVTELMRKPGHEKVRSLVHELCVVGLDVSERELNFEVPVPEVRGRMDALLGDTVFEFKSNLGRERAEAEDQLERYLGERERATGRRFLGIATDGAAFVAYQLEGGILTRLDDVAPKVDDPRALLRWLDTAVSVREDLQATADTIHDELGRDSLVYKRAMHELRDVWGDAWSIPEVDLKRQLWGRHLAFVYGTLVAADDLFLQHTYLTLVAKIMAARALTTGPLGPDSLLNGTPFVESGLNGAVEIDFFDWLRHLPAGERLVQRLIRQVDRFNLADIQADVLKGLYESLIDPRQRHYLGEYYTPDWLAEWVYEEAVADPLDTRILDPACGSGTFLFHGVRRFIQAAEQRGIALDDALEGCTDHVIGVDVHPVAVLFARVTYLLAIGPDRLHRKSRAINVPVYLGDSLQWDVRAFMSEETIDIAVPDGPELRFPSAVAGDANLLERILRRMDDLCARNAPLRTFLHWLNDEKLHDDDRRILGQTYQHLSGLHRAGRNHIWVYVVRNLTRPLWLSLRGAMPDLLIGNPPWLKFNAMSAGMQAKFRDHCRARGLWVGGTVATNQDLSAYFFARCAERYLKVGGRIAFVMPMATLSRSQFKNFRTGRFGNAATVRFTDAWLFDNDVQPLFPVPAAVLFGERTIGRQPRPDAVTAFRGTLPVRNAGGLQARAALVRQQTSWPTEVERQGGSPYRRLFRQGATILPRKLFMITRERAGRLGDDPAAPVVVSERRTQEKLPWKHLPPLRSQIEKQFIHPVLLGESIAPFRVLSPATAIIPSADGRLLDAEAALEAGHLHLNTWLGEAEALWAEHGTRGLTLLQRIDYHGGLSSQAGRSPLALVYSKSGSRPAAAIVRTSEWVIDHKLYWFSPATEDEARFLAAVLNSETVRSRIAHLQSRGQFGGGRDFDKVAFSLPIPRFQPRNSLHRRLANAASTAEAVAGAVHLPEAAAYQTARRVVRQTLLDDGISLRIDSLVEELLAAGLE